MSFHELPKDEWTHQQTRLRCKHTAEWRRLVTHEEGIRNNLLKVHMLERQQCCDDLFVLRQQQQQALMTLEQQSNQTRQALRARQAEEMAELRKQTKAARQGLPC
ncbi:hypothetical protein [Spirosoma sp. KUDC1026]|uniref:hypothetical protein n=1 Tax=Spirosoma sp. KUDC1026 TaxID=2745947 RepID=UPI00159BA87B|nr:hypothetical protein [Spirosoma sp. KUDC1026]QKZ14229.1 hypothetical protein HU175_16980 [Spirosoma sp. KUDC1026]